MPDDGNVTVIPEQLPATTTVANTLAPTSAPAMPNFDPDDLELAAARAEVAAEETGGSAATTTTQPPARPPAQGAPKPGQRGNGQRPIAIPKARFDEVSRQAQALRDENLYLKGALEASRATHGQPAAPGASGQPGAGQTQQQTVEQQIQAQAAVILAASEKFDQGEMTLKEFKVIELAATDVIANLRANHLLAHVQSTIPRPGPGLADGERLQQHIEEMATAHPWSAVLSDGEIAFLADIARAEANGLGRPIQPGPAGTLRLRTAVAELADVYGPRWYPNHQIEQPATVTQVPSTQAPAASAQPTNGRVSAAQRAVETAARQPPNIATAGHADTGASVLTDAKVEAMTEDELLALPRAVRERYLNG